MFFRSGTTQLLGPSRQLARYWHPKEFEIDRQTISFEVCRLFVFHRSRGATPIITLSPLSRTDLVVNACWFHTLVSSNFVLTQDCYVAELAAVSKSFTQLGSDEPQSSLSLIFMEHLTQWLNPHKLFFPHCKIPPYSKFCSTLTPGFFS